MKAIILSAGKGTRLGKYTSELPKGMLNFLGLSIIERQIGIYRECEINNISVVGGYKAEKIKLDRVKLYINKDYDKTNMVESLFCSKDEFDDDLIVSYSDILFKASVLRGLKQSTADVTVTVDSDWQEYWSARYGRVDFDLEGLELDGDRIKKSATLIHLLKQ